MQWETLAVVCTLAWLNLLGDVRQLPYLGIYVIMFFDILKTFLQFVVVFLIFIVAFALGKKNCWEDKKSVLINNYICLKK